MEIFTYYNLSEIAKLYNNLTIEILNNKAIESLKELNFRIIIILIIEEI